MATDQQRAWSNRDRGSRPPNWQRPKLTPAQRADIRRRVDEGEQQQALALEFGVTRSTISHYS